MAKSARQARGVILVVAALLALCGRVAAVGLGGRGGLRHIPAIVQHAAQARGQKLQLGGRRNMDQEWPGRRRESKEVEEIQRVQSEIAWVREAGILRLARGWGGEHSGEAETGDAWAVTAGAKRLHERAGMYLKGEREMNGEMHEFGEGEGVMRMRGGFMPSIYQHKPDEPFDWPWKENADGIKEYNEGKMSDIDLWGMGNKRFGNVDPRGPSRITVLQEDLDQYKGEKDEVCRQAALTQMFLVVQNHKLEQ